MAATHPQTSDELLERIASERSALHESVDSLSQDQLTAPGGDGWSIKDHLAHIAAWERIVLWMMGKDSDADAVRTAIEQSADWNTDRYNQLVYESWAQRPVDEVREEFEGAHDDLIAALGDLSDEDLLKALPRQEPDDTAPAYDYIADSTYRHYAQHRGWMKSYLA